MDIVVASGTTVGQVGDGVGVFGPPSGVGVTVGTPGVKVGAAGVGLKTGVDEGCGVALGSLPS